MAQVTPHFTTIPQLLNARAHDLPTETFITFTQGSQQRHVTFLQFYANVTHLATVLQHIYSLQSHSTLGIWASNSYKYAELAFSCQLIGARILPFNVNLPAATVSELIVRADCKLLAISLDMLDHVESLIGASNLHHLPRFSLILSLIDQLDCLFILDFAESIPNYTFSNKLVFLSPNDHLIGQRDLSLFRGQASLPPLNQPTINQDDIAVILHTSGTQNTPKVCPFYPLSLSLDPQTCKLLTFSAFSLFL